VRSSGFSPLPRADEAWWYQILASIPIRKARLYTKFRHDHPIKRLPYYMEKNYAAHLPDLFPSKPSIMARWESDRACPTLLMIYYAENHHRRPWRKAQPLTPHRPGTPILKFDLLLRRFKWWSSKTVVLLVKYDKSRHASRVTSVPPWKSSNSESAEPVPLCLPFKPWSTGNASPITAMTSAVRDNRQTLEDPEGCNRRMKLLKNSIGWCNGIGFIHLSVCI